jgi:hypothetical protein
MDNDILKVPKILRSVSLWVHPEGRVTGSIYLREHSPDHAGSETPQEMLNQGDTFFVFRREHPDELRFYNVRSVIRVEYEEDGAGRPGKVTQLECHLQMMDGSFIKGQIRESLAPDRARLLDYLNRGRDVFIKIHLDDQRVYLINKSYIINVHIPGSEG